MKIHVEVYGNEKTHEQVGDLADTVEGIHKVEPIVRTSDTKAWAFEYISVSNGGFRTAEALEIGWILGKLEVSYSVIVEWWVTA